MMNFQSHKKNMDFNKEKQEIQKIKFNCIRLENIMYGYDKQNLILKMLI